MQSKFLHDFRSVCFYSPDTDSEIGGNHLICFPPAKSRIISVWRGVGLGSLRSGRSACFPLFRNPFTTISDTLGVRKRLPAETAFTALTRFAARSDFKT